MSKKVLIAEDSSVIQTLTSKILEAQNYDISKVKNGRQVLELLNDEDFDLILMDLNMPELDGMECTRQIRSMSNEEKSSIPIIAITGNAENYSIEEMKEAGLNDYVPKPINYDHLVDVVNKYTS